MSTLVLHAPRSRARNGEAASFEDVLASGIGDGYIIGKSLRPRILDGCKIVVLDKDQELRAEGRLRCLVESEKAGNYQQRYNVHIIDLKRVHYKPERLNRNGIAFLD